MYLPAATSGRPLSTRQSKGQRGRCGRPRCTSKRYLRSALLWRFAACWFCPGSRRCHRSGDALRGAYRRGCVRERRGAEDTRHRASLDSQQGRASGAAGEGRDRGVASDHGGVEVVLRSDHVGTIAPAKVQRPDRWCSATSRSSHVAYPAVLAKSSTGAGFKPVPVPHLRLSGWPGRLLPTCRSALNVSWWV